MSRAAVAHLFSRPPGAPPTGQAAADQSRAVLEALNGLEEVLSRARSNSTADDWAEAQRVAHQLYVSAEQAALAEVANAVLHIEDAVAAMATGELVADASSFRQVEAALGAARAACEMSQASPAVAPEAAPSRGLAWIVGDAPELQGELLKAAHKKRLSTRALSVEQALLCDDEAPDVCIVDLGSHDPDALLEAFGELKRAAPRMALVVLSPTGAFRVRTAAAGARAALFFVEPVEAEKVLLSLDGLDLGKDVEKARVLSLALNGSVDWLRGPLEEEGMEVKPLYHPELVLDALDASQPSALVLDLGGEQAALICRVVRATPRFRDLPILVRTRPFTDAARACFEAGADDVLPMEISGSELSARLRVRLDRTRAFRERSNRDLLTGLLMRRAFTEGVLARLAEAQRSRRHLSLCLMDVDRFKLVNDTYGHGVGDKVLASLGGLLGTRFRLQDLRGRWGGEEFIVAFYGEWAESAREILSRVTGEFAKITFDGGEGRSFNVTVSGGIATFPLDGRSLDELVEVADQRLYAAKQAGRNRIKI